MTLQKVVHSLQPVAGNLTTGSPPSVRHPLRPTNAALIEEIALLKRLMHKNNGDGHNAEYAAVLNETIRRLMARELGE